jgi:hypothetical protein
MSRKMQSFIRENRKEITKRIFKLHPDLEDLKSVNDEERRVMVINEPTLKNYARSQGVVID